MSNSNRKVCEPSRPLTLSNQSVTPAGSEFAILDGIPENYIYGEQSGGDLRIRHRSGAKGRPKRAHCQAKASVEMVDVHTQSNVVVIASQMAPSYTEKRIL